MRRLSNTGQFFFISFLNKCHVFRDGSRNFGALCRNFFGGGGNFFPKISVRHLFAFSAQTKKEFLTVFIISSQQIVLLPCWRPLFLPLAPPILTFGAPELWRPRRLSIGRQRVKQTSRIQQETSKNKRRLLKQNSNVTVPLHRLTPSPIYCLRSKSTHL